MLLPSLTVLAAVAATIPAPDTVAVQATMGARWDAEGVTDVRRIADAPVPVWTADYDDGLGCEAWLCFTDSAMLPVLRQTPEPDLRLKDVNGEDVACDFRRSLSDIPVTADSEGGMQITFTVTVTADALGETYVLAKVFYEYVVGADGHIVLRSARPVSDDITALLDRFTPYLYNSDTDDYDRRATRADLGSLLRPCLPPLRAVPLLAPQSQQSPNSP